MKRRLSLLVLSSFLVAVACPLQPVDAADPPNVVMIIGDDQAWGDFGFMGHPVIQTPNLDRLASQSLVFTRGYVPSSLCRPSLATLATGLYPHQHRITSNDPPEALPKDEFLRQRQEQIANIERVPTLPRLLAAKGYLSMQTGKWWEGHYSRGGFTHGMTHGDPKRGGRHGDEGLKIGRQGLEPIFEFIEEAVGSRQQAVGSRQQAVGSRQQAVGSRQQAVGSRQKAAGSGSSLVIGHSFFVWYAPFLPHRPHNPPERLLEKYRDKTDSIHVARYWAMCQWFDETCGQLLDFLDDKGLADNTLVVFVVDNGWIQLPGASGYAPKSKRSPYDGGLRTPIMLRLPGRIEPARDDQTPVVSVDLVPTILAACGLKPTSDMQGVNLLDREALSRRQAIFGATFAHNAVDIHNPASSLEYRWCIENRWKLLVPNPANVPDAKPVRRYRRSPRRNRPPREEPGPRRPPPRPN